MPAAIPVTVPPADTDATAALLLLHVPPPGVQLIAIASPWHTTPGPLIAVGMGITVNDLLTAQLPIV